MESQSKKNSTITNLLWRFMERCGAQGVSFVVSIVLARLLAPEIYGTIALVTVFTSIMQVFVDSGMANALIQKKDADEVDFSSVFYMNMAICIVLYTVMFLAAPLIAGFYQKPELVNIVRVLSLTLVISGVRNVQQAYVSRNLLFKKFFFSTISATVMAAVVGISMAYAGFGVWALVGQQLTQATIGTAVLWMTVRWRPKWAFSMERLKGLLSYGWKILAAALLETVYNDLRQLIIGKMYSADDLAYYNQGVKFPQFIVVNVNASINSVLLPTMSKVQDDQSRIRGMTRKAIRTSTYIMAPLMTGLAVCAEPIVRLVLTEQWLPCVFFLRIFCISYMFYPIHTANLSAIKAMGRSDLFLKLEIWKKVVGLVLVLSSMWFGVKVIAVSLLVGTIISSIINTYPNKKLLNYSWIEQMKDILPYILIAGAMGVPVYLVGMLPAPVIAALALQVATGVLFYVGASIVLKLEIFIYLLDTLKSMLRRKKRAH